MEWKDARHMSNVCNEIIESERNYINDLQVKIPLRREQRTEKRERRREKGGERQRRENREQRREDRDREGRTEEGEGRVGSSMEYAA